MAWMEEEPLTLSLCFFDSQRTVMKKERLLACQRFVGVLHALQSMVRAGSSVDS